jgi:hypothetical protein
MRSLRVGEGIFRLLHPPNDHQPAHALLGQGELIALRRWMDMRHGNSAGVGDTDVAALRALHLLQTCPRLVPPIPGACLADAASQQAVRVDSVRGTTGAVPGPLRLCTVAIVTFGMATFSLRVVRDRITRAELALLATASFGDMVKAVMDVERRIVAIGGELQVAE